MNQNRKEQIIQVAACQFRKKGYQSVSMRELADEMGIKAASLYNHIKAKDEILSLIVMGLAEEFISHITTTRRAQISAVEKLKSIIEMHVNTTFEKTDYLACMNKEWRHLGEKEKSTFVKSRREYERQFLEIVYKGIEKQELRAVDPFIFSKSFLSLLRTIYHWYDSYPGITKEVLTQNLLENLFFGVVNPDIPTN